MRKYFKQDDRSYSRANRLRPINALSVRFICYSAIAFLSTAIIFAIPSVRTFLSASSITIDVVGGILMAVTAAFVSILACLRLVAECLNARVLRCLSRTGIRQRLCEIEKSSRFQVADAHFRSMRLGAVAFGAAAVVSAFGWFYGK